MNSSSLPFKMAQNHAQLGALVLSAMILTVFTYLIIDALIVPGNLESENANTTDTNQGVATITEHSPNQNYAQQIIALNVFGEARMEQPKQAVVVKKTRLNLKLLGVLNAIGNEQTSIAIIAEASGSEIAVRVGEQIPGGATLEEVHPTHIIIKRSGQLERLDLAQKEVQLGRPLPTPPPAH